MAEARLGDECRRHVQVTRHDPQARIATRVEADAVLPQEVARDAVQRREHGRWWRAATLMFTPLLSDCA
eukprot:scaffold78064_cov39-Phaeocystis_antarctica.AAC.3